MVVYFLFLGLLCGNLPAVNPENLGKGRAELVEGWVGRGLSWGHLWKNVKKGLSWERAELEKGWAGGNPVRDVMVTKYLRCSNSVASRFSKNVLPLPFSPCTQKKVGASESPSAERRFVRRYWKIADCDIMRKIRKGKRQRERKGEEKKKRGKKEEGW